MKKKIKIMQITHDLALGGLQQVVVNICRSLDRDKFDVTVMCIRNLGELVPEIEKMGIKVFFAPHRANTADYFLFLKMAKIFRDEKIDIIHTHNTQPFTDGTIAAILSGVKGIIHTDHARTFPDKKRYMFAEWLMSQFAYKVVGVSEHTSSNLIKYEKISKKKMETIQNGVDGSIYNIRIDKDKKKKEIGIHLNGYVIGLGVRLIEQKGITCLLEAMKDIITIFPDLTLVVAGEGDYEEQLKKEAYEFGVDKNTIFIGSRLDMPEILQLFDIYVLPSYNEGLPMVLLEAMAAGCPILSTNVGGISTAIEHGENGSLVEAKRSDLLSAEIIKMLNDENLRKKYISKGYEVFNLKFSSEIMVKQYQKLYFDSYNK